MDCLENYFNLVITVHVLVLGFLMAVLSGRSSAPLNFFCEEIYYIYTTYNISSKISGHCSQPKLAKLTLATETNIVGSMLTTGFYL